MKVEKRLLQKADPRLREALASAEGREVIRAVVRLGAPGQEENGAASSEGLDPGAFESRQAYRKAQLARRQEEVSRDIGDTVRALDELSLAPRGGKMGRTVVVEGPAHQVAAALGLPGVLHASLDRPMKLVEPRRRRPSPPKRSS
jgi:hypothetical protein